ncbi:MAG: hypothetical protein HY233_01610 [Acidobacteriales bacterium]|nr:hypothetical protein [Candidatus Koribacter versatilis]MBI3644652.1 hypothetical protein [Terriglobales bacterium]
MVKVSTLRKIGIAAQVLARQARTTRTGAAVLSGVRTALQSFGRVAHQLWLEVTGFIFLALAGIGGIAGFREYAKYQAGQAEGPGRLILAACFTVTFAWFGVSSFWRVRRKH